MNQPVTISAQKMAIRRAVWSLFGMCADDEYMFNY
jgi:hypothetical protein